MKTAVAYLLGGLGTKFILNQPLTRFFALLLATVADMLLAQILSFMVNLLREHVPQVIAIDFQLLHPIL